MKIQTVRVEDDLAFIVPRELAIKLDIEEGKSFFLTETPDGGLLISPRDANHEKAMQIAREVAVEYHTTLCALAKE